MNTTIQLELELDKRINEKLDYLYSMSDKFEELNKKLAVSHELDRIYSEIHALENLKNGITGEWNDCYKEHLKLYENEKRRGNL